MVLRPTRPPNVQFFRCPAVHHVPPTPPKFNSSPVTFAKALDKLRKGGTAGSHTALCPGPCLPARPGTNRGWVHQLEDRMSYCPSDEAPSSSEDLSFSSDRGPLTQLHVLQGACMRRSHRCTSAVDASRRGIRRRGGAPRGLPHSRFSSSSDLATANMSEHGLAAGRAASN